MSSLGEELPREMARVRDKVLPGYLALGAIGAPAAFMMRRSLDNAAAALAEQDIAGMIVALEDLKGYSL